MSEWETNECGQLIKIVNGHRAVVTGCRWDVWPAGDYDPEENNEGTFSGYHRSMKKPWPKPTTC